MFGDNSAYNRFTNLDSLEDRIIYYLLSEDNKNEEQLKLVHTIWRILYYNDNKCLIDDATHPLPKFNDIRRLIDNDSINQNTKRVFRSPWIEDTFDAQASILRIYIDSITPVNRLTSQVNIAVETIIHNKLTNVVNPLYDENDEIINPTEEYPLITTKNRCSILLKCVLALLNGADVAGIGTLQFNRKINYYNQSRLGIWNNRNYYGYKSVFGTYMSGVSTE